jgi:hypothetical protein
MNSEALRSLAGSRVTLASYLVQIGRVGQNELSDAEVARLSSGCPARRDGQARQPGADRRSFRRYRAGNARRARYCPGLNQRGQDYLALSQRPLRHWPRRGEPRFNPSLAALSPRGQTYADWSHASPAAC